MTESSAPDPNTAPYPEPTEYYLPQELGLNDKNSKDMELYVQSGGLRDAGELLIEKRKITTSYELGNPDLHVYHSIMKTMDEAIAQVFQEHEQRQLDRKG